MSRQNWSQRLYQSRWAIRELVNRFNRYRPTPVVKAGLAENLKSGSSHSGYPFFAAALGTQIFIRVASRNILMRL
jgi:hypothetical protein